jgi:hypothetical protein
MSIKTAEELDKLQAAGSVVRQARRDGRSSVSENYNGGAG